MSEQTVCYLYIASCVPAPDGGIYRYRLTDGNPEPAGFTPMPSPMYMITDNSGKEPAMHVVLLDPYDRRESGLVTYRMDKNGDLCDPSAILSTRGETACHLCAHEGEIYAVNYDSGSVFRTPDLLVTHTGRSVNPNRQNEAHTHYVHPTPDGRFLCVTDLGMDQIILYDRDLHPHSAVRLPDGHGPRHLVFHEDGTHVFCMNELESTVSLLRYSDGEMELLDTVSALPDDFTGESTGAAIRCTGNTVYSSNRGHDSIAVFDFTDGKLIFRKTVPTFGANPRDFIVVGDRIIATNEAGNCVCFVSVTDGTLLRKIDMPAPLCAVTAELPAPQNK